jgi:hypothetical protein
MREARRNSFQNQTMITADKKAVEDAEEVAATIED